MFPINAHTKRTLIWTPDASRGMGLIADTPSPTAKPGTYQPIRNDSPTRR